jgi:hypothetical protein
MSNDRSARAFSGPVESNGASHAAWARPSFEVIPLDCEITAYAPDGDSPLF